MRWHLENSICLDLQVGPRREGRLREISSDKSSSSIVSLGNGYQCTELSYLHSASFGIFMLQRTMTESFSFDARGFAIGFAGHVFGDFIGFFSKLLNNHRRGLLCAQHVGECKADILYLPLWSLMADMDAYFAMTNNIVASTLVSSAALDLYAPHL